MTAPETPPLERFAQHTIFGDVAWLGPQTLLYTSDVSGQRNIWSEEVGPHGERGFTKQLTAFSDWSVRFAAPTLDRRWIFFAADRDGDEQLQLYRLSARGGDPEAITSDRKVRHEFIGAGLDRTGRRILYTDNARKPADMDVILHDLERGTTLRPLEPGHLWSSAAWDPTARRFSVHMIHSNTRVQAFVHDLARKSTVEILPHQSDDFVIVDGWTRDGRGLLVRTDLGSEFAQLELLDLVSGKRKVLAAPKADVEDAQFVPESGALVYAVNEEGYSVLYAGRLGGKVRRISSLPPGHLPLSWGKTVAIASDGKSGAALWTQGSHPTEVMWFPLAAGRSTQLTESMVGGVPDQPLPGPQLVRFPTFDGRKIPAFYYLPKHRPKGRMPAVLSIHGGPESQERPGWMYSGLYAFLNSRGIAVLAPNIRGSTGYGKSYQKLIVHDWGGNELKDLRAAAEWLRSRREIDPDRMGVFGGSFGGFATLECVTRLPEYWKVGVDVIGPSNLITFVKSVPPFWTRFMDEWVGNPDTEAEFLRERSPITYIDNVRASLLIIQGANDPRVNKAESDQMVERLRAKGRAVDYMVFDDEGHGFTKHANTLKATAAIANFLVIHLTG